MTGSSLENQITNAARLIENARHFIIFSGAGISTSSGIPDFRGEKEGLWQRLDPMRVASASSFFNTPAVFYDWFRPLFMTSWLAQPNPAHRIIADLEKLELVKTVITQNIDGLHQKAGSQKVMELHGTAMRFTCPACNTQSAAKEVFSLFQKGINIPLCDRCGKVIKPEVVLFEEALPQWTWTEAVRESEKADLIMVIGSSLEVYPASSIPQITLDHGGKLLINNLTATPLDHQATLVIRMDAAKFFPLLMKEISISGTG